jgi:MoaA/NifB/PqqE/SkfB family radical SAM enzyme
MESSRAMDKPTWTRILLEPVVSGCPNQCRHCMEAAGPPFGELMSLDDVKWLVGEFERASQAALQRPLKFWIEPELFEPSAHPDFLRLYKYAMSFIPRSRWDDFCTFNTNGYGLARIENWKPVFEALRPANVQGFGMAIHGVEAEHDWFVRRTGAYRDIATVTRRALDSQMDVDLEIHLNKRNVSSFGSIVDNLEEMAFGQAKIYSGIPGFFMNDRLRAFEALRPTRADKERIADILQRAPDRGSDTEASWVRQLAESGRKAGLCSYARPGQGPTERSLGRMRVSPSFDVTELFFSRPPVRHGNVKRDGIDAVWAHVMETCLAPMPEPEVLAQRYGDSRSEALHPGPDSVYMKLCDAYWRDGRSVAGAA